MFKRLSIFGACLAAALCTLPAANAADPTYVVGSGGTYRPFEFENSKKELEGFDIDVISAIAKAENFNIKLVNTLGKAFLQRWAAAIATLLFPVSPLPTSVSRWLTSLLPISLQSRPLSCQKARLSAALPI